MRAAAANLMVSLDNGHILAQFHGLHGGSFATWTGSNHDNVVLKSVHPRILRVVYKLVFAWRVAVDRSDVGLENPGEPVIRPSL
jgi:hypothetical protein